MSIIVDREMRLARAERYAEVSRAGDLDVLEAAYQQAARDGDTEYAAAAARAIRDKLLALSDQYVTLDRVGLDTSSITALVASLRNVFGGAWPKYRQQLRDLPQQEGFPFQVEFPKPPDTEAQEGDAL